MQVFSAKQLIHSHCVFGKHLHMSNDVICPQHHSKLFTCERSSYPKNGAFVRSEIQQLIQPLLAIVGCIAYFFMQVAARSGLRRREAEFKTLSSSGSCLRSSNSHIRSPPRREMWLLDTSTLKLHDFMNDYERPHFAIVSHT